MTTTDLIEQLRKNAEGSKPDVAAIELLISHGIWLNRSKFRELYIRDLSEKTDPEDPDPIELVDPYISWQTLRSDLELDHFCQPSTGSEYRILQIAVSLTTAYRVNLNSVFSGLDDVNTERVLTAIRYTLQGSRESRPPLASWKGDE